MCESVWKGSPDRERGVEMPLPIIQGSREVRSMLVIHQGALGDFILALPTLETLRKTFPSAKLAMMGYPGILELVEKRFYAEEIFSIDQRGMASFFIEGGELDRRLSHFVSTFDLIVAFGKNGEGALIRNLNRICPGRIVPIHSFPIGEGKIHLTDHLLKEFSRYGFSISGVTSRIYLGESDREWGRGFWRERGVTREERRETIILHPGSGSKRKVWPLERFLALLGYFQEGFRSKVLVVVGPAEGTEVEEPFRKPGSDGVFLAKGLSLLQLASVMEGCRFLIGNDSGISHLSAALGIPTVAIFGPTDPMVWAPRGEKVVVVCRGIGCSPCPQNRFAQCQDFECLKGIGVGDVLEGVKTLGLEV